MIEKKRGVRKNSVKIYMMNSGNFDPPELRLMQPCAK